MNRPDDSLEQGFPFEEVARFDSLEQVPADIPKSHIWSVTVADLDCGCTCWSYGPSHHWVNLMHYVQTAEAHDGDTYYHDTSHLDSCLETFTQMPLKQRYFDLEIEVAEMTASLEESDEIIRLQSMIALLFEGLTDGDIKWLEDTTR